MIVYSQAESLPKGCLCNRQVGLGLIAVMMGTVFVLDVIATGVMMMGTVFVVDVIATGVMIMVAVFVVGAIVAGVMMMVAVFVLDIIVTGVMMVAVFFVDAIVAGVMIMFAVFVVDIIVTGVVRRMVRRRGRVIAVDFIAASDGFSRCSRRKGGKNESNKNFELHICLEY